MDLIQPLFKSGHSTSAPTGMNGRRVKISSRMGDLWSGVCSEFLNILPQSEDWLPTCRSQVVRPRPLKFIVGAFEKDFIRRKRAHLDVLSGESMFVDVPTDDKVNVFKELPPVGDVINHISRFELELDYYGNLVPDFDTNGVTVLADISGSEHPPFVMLASRGGLPLHLGHIEPRPALRELLDL